MVSVFSAADEEISFGGRPRKVPADTPFHLSIVSANRDPAVFGHTADEFDPTRPELDQLVTWNGLEKGHHERQSRARPPRHCPGHDFSIGVVMEVVRNFMPDIVKFTATRGDVLSDAQLARYKAPWTSTRG